VSSFAALARVRPIGLSRVEIAAVPAISVPQTVLSFGTGT
jgi:hypothetical protein